MTAGIRPWLVTVGALAISLPVQEMAVRFALPEFDPARQVRVWHRDGLPALAEPGEFRQAKNTGDFNVRVEVNAHGLRDDKDVAAAGPADWLLVGNSYMFGWGVEARDRTSDRLQTALGRPVYNLAVPGGDFDSYARLLDYANNLGSRSQRLIIGVTMENNLHAYGDANPAPEGKPQPPDREKQFLAIKVWLTRNTELYFLATSLVHSNQLVERAAAALGLVIPNLAGIHKAHFDEAVIATSVQRLVTIAGRTRRTIVMLIPSRALWQGEANERAVADHVHTAFSESCRAAGLTVIDLRPVFEAEGKPLSYHFANDGHWSPRGHALAAQTLADALGKEKD